MAATTVEGVQQEGRGRGGGARTGPFRWRASVALVAILAVTGALALRWFAASADAFGGVRIVSGGSDGLVPGTASHWSGTGDLPPVEVTRAEVVLDSSSGPAAAAAWLCIGGGGGFGGVRGDLSQYCDDVLPLTGADLSEAPEDAVLAISVAPLTSAPAHVVGLRLAFEDGWRSGEQTIPVDLTLLSVSS